VFRPRPASHAHYRHVTVTFLNSSVVIGRPFVKRKTVRLCYQIVCLSVLSVCLSVCDVRALWPNGWTDQDKTWHAGRPRPWPHCVRWRPRSTLPKKGAEPPSPILGPLLLWPYGCMHEDATWYGGRPQPRGLCVRWGPSPPKFLDHVDYSYCDFVRTLHNAQSLLFVQVQVLVFYASCF